MKVPTPLLRLVLLAAVATSTSARTTTLQPFQCPSTLLLPPLTDLSRTCLPLVDDTTPSHEPWAYPPRCAEPVPGSKKQLAKYCVYTYIAPDPNGDRGGRGGGNGNGGAPKVGGGGGISVATTPYVAAEAAGIIAHFAPRWASEGSSFHLDPAGIAHPQPGTGRSQPQPAVEVRPIPGKGLGVVALRDIAENEIIFREAPYLVDISQQLDLRDPREEGLILQRSVSQLPARDRDRVWDMARSLGSSDILGDIMRTNVFGIVVAGVDHSGLYPAISRINHACKPK